MTRLAPACVLLTSRPSPPFPPPSLPAAPALQVPGDADDGPKARLLSSLRNDAIKLLIAAAADRPYNEVRGRQGRGGARQWGRLAPGCAGQEVGLWVRSGVAYQARPLPLPLPCSHL